MFNKADSFTPDRSRRTLSESRIVEINNEFERDPQQSIALARLGEYLHVLQAEAFNARRLTRSRAESHHHHGGSSSVGGAPDSAIDISYDDLEGAASPARKPPTTPPTMRASLESLEEEINDFVGELSEMPTQPPAPPNFATNRQAGLLRRSGSKLSSTFRSLGLKRPSLKTVDDNPEMEPSAVFGVPLTKSIQIAKGIAHARHGNDGSSTRTAREYPLCVLRCVYYIRDCGIETPDIFGLDRDGDQVRLKQLKETFNSAEAKYGKELDWSMFTVHDAAELILLFLMELPKPVISESVGKRWISLSRQATVRGARLDQGLDFWEEALMGIHGPRRTLFKLLLNLWGDIADSADANDMTAERLAGRVIRPLMQETAARRPTDFLLGLAFLIRKRSEYNLAARGVVRKSNAAF
ncbi:hypothetical protein NEMBOFW57_003764 [Staphylotrichum longicolle]|uniref:Rho-GAP domain-containing protein n=1 Tax=Staphylotrichum longicolle TaxID=669026 RepID=A0AAD4F8G7_9PEZI|nr:hypothetical protein NEMBOFW57_003764 [Staphylotrichum longicolle]